MSVPVTMTTEYQALVQRAMDAFRGESSYTTDMVKAAQAVQARRAKR